MEENKALKEKILDKEYDEYFNNACSNTNNHKNYSNKQHENNKNSKLVKVFQESKENTYNKCSLKSSITKTEQNTLKKEFSNSTYKNSEIRGNSIGVENDAANDSYSFVRKETDSSNDETYCKLILFFKLKIFYLTFSIYSQR